MKFRVITVEAVLASDGWPQPLTLRWQGETLTVTEIGRRWQADNGLHVLVRVTDGRVFELHTNGTLWRAQALAAPPHVV